MGQDRNFTVPHLVRHGKGKKTHCSMFGATLDRTKLTVPCLHHMGQDKNLLFYVWRDMGQGLGPDKTKKAFVPPKQVEQDGTRMRQN